MPIRDWARRAAEASAWYARRRSIQPLATRVRSRELLEPAGVTRAVSRAQDLGNRDLSFGSQECERIIGELLEFTPDLVDDVVLARRRLLRESAAMPSGDGRLLVFLPQEALSSGLAEQESNGILDASECPGWDLWLGSLSRMEIQAFERIRDHWTWDLLVVCWIPVELCDAVQAGIDVDPVEPLVWLPDGVLNQG